MFGFITSKSLLANLVFAVLLIAGAVFIFFESLDFLTKHGEQAKVPSILGKSVEEATQLLEAQGFDVAVQDSVYYDTIAPLSVIKQFPEPNSTVKVNRTIFLTINRAVPPSVDMPNLVGLSFRNAEIYLKQFGLKLGDTSYRPDFASNSVLQQMYGGLEIKPGTKIQMGSAISLVLGSGLSNQSFPIPDLFGKTYSEAKLLLDASGVGIGAVVLESGITDTAAAFVFRQNPEAANEEGKSMNMRPGQLMDLWLTINKPQRAESDTSAVKTIPDNQ